MGLPTAPNSLLWHMNSTGTYCRRKQKNSHLFPAIRMNIALTIVKYQEIDKSRVLGHMITIHGNDNLRPKPVHSTCNLQGGTLLYQGFTLKHCI